MKHHTNLQVCPIISIQRFFLVLLICFAGCATRTRIGIPPKTDLPSETIPTHQFDKTFGEISVGKSASLIIRYKTITLIIDPDFDDPQTAAILPQTDYLLVTDAGPRHFSDAVRANARKNIKIISSNNEASKIKAGGFTEVKSIGNGQRIMLKKNSDFVFVSAVPHQNPTTKRQVNSYLIEFDNGRNIFISGEATRPDDLREFVYSLRDDGKEIYAGFFYRQPNLGDDALAQIISLIQPKNVLLLQSDFPDIPKLNEPQFREALKSELFEGPFSVVSNGRTIEF